MKRFMVFLKPFSFCMCQINEGRKIIFSLQRDDAQSLIFSLWEGCIQETGKIMEVAVKDQTP
jgi:hypothetical protein